VVWSVRQRNDADSQKTWRAAASTATKPWRRRCRNKDTVELSSQDVVFRNGIGWLNGHPMADHVISSTVQHRERPVYCPNPLLLDIRRPFVGQGASPVGQSADKRRRRAVRQINGCCDNPRSSFWENERQRWRHGPGRAGPGRRRLALFDCTLPSVIESPDRYSPSCMAVAVGR